MYLLLNGSDTQPDEAQARCRLCYEYPEGNHIYFVHTTVHIVLRVDTVCTDRDPCLRVPVGNLVLYGC